MARASWTENTNTPGPGSGGVSPRLACEPRAFQAACSVGTLWCQWSSDDSSSAAHRYAQNRTGLGEPFDLDIEFARAGLAETTDLPQIATALKEQLGLDLRSATGPVSVIVIDQVDLPAAD